MWGNSILTLEFSDLRKYLRASHSSNTLDLQRIEKSPQIKKRQKLPHKSLPELQLREYEPEGGKSTLAHLLATSPKIKNRQKLPHQSFPELKIRQYGPEGGKSTLAHLLDNFWKNVGQLLDNFLTTVLTFG